MSWPDKAHLKLPFVLWIRGAVQYLVEHKLQIKLSVRAVGNYLEGCGLHLRGRLLVPLNAIIRKLKSGLQSNIHRSRKVSKNKEAKYTGEMKLVLDKISYSREGPV